MILFKFLNFSYIVNFFTCSFGLLGAALTLGGISAAANLGQTIYNHFQTKKANKMSSDQFNQMMDFQRNSYRYTAEDLKNAGLNPSLLASGSASASSAPSGTSFSANRASGLDTIASSLASTALAGHTQKTIADNNNDTQSNISASNNSTAKEIAAMNNATMLALKSKDKSLQDAQIKLMNEQAKSAAASAREQKRSTDYWESVGADPSSSDKIKIAKEAVYNVAKGVKSLSSSVPNSAPGSTDSSSYLDKYVQLGDKFSTYYPTLNGFARAISADTGTSEKSLLKDPEFRKLYLKLKGKK